MGVTQITSNNFRNFAGYTSGYQGWRVGYKGWINTTNLQYERNAYKTLMFFPTASIAAAMAGNILDRIKLTLVPGTFSLRQNALVQPWRMANVTSMPPDESANYLLDDLHTTTDVGTRYVERLTGYTVDKNNPTTWTIAEGAAAQQLLQSLLAGNCIGLFTAVRDEGTSLFIDSESAMNYNGGYDAPILTLEYHPGISTFTLNKGSAEAGETITATINAQHASYTHKIKCTLGSTLHTVNVASGALQYSVGFAFQLSQLTAIPSSLSGIGRVTVETYDGATLIGSNFIDFTVNVPSSVVPTMDPLTVERVDNGVPAAWGVYVQSKSKVKFTINNPLGAYGSTINYIRIYGANADGYVSPFTTPAITSSGDVLFTAIIRDTRGRTATRTATVHFEAYDVPRITGAIAYRCDEAGVAKFDGTFIRCALSYQFSSVLAKNSIKAFTVKTALFGTSDYSTIHSTVHSSGEEFTTGGSILADKSYLIKFTIQDEFNTIESVIPLPSAKFGWHAKANGKGIGIGQMAEKDDTCIINPLWTLEAYGQKIGVPSNPDFLINSNFSIWQSAVSFLNAAVQNYTADMWTGNGNLFCDVTKVAEGMQRKCVTSGYYMGINQKIEMSTQAAYNLIGKEMCLSYCVKVSAAAKTYNGSTVPYNTDFIQTIKFTFTQAHYDFVVSNGWSNCILDRIGIQSLENGAQLPVNFTCTFKWVKLEIGSFPTPFVSRPFAEELLLCQRYYENSWYPMAKDQPNEHMAQLWSNNNSDIRIEYKVQKRIRPTVTIVPEGANANVLYYATNGTYYVAASSSVISRGVASGDIIRFVKSASDVSTWVTGQTLQARVHWEANARI